MLERTLNLDKLPDFVGHSFRLALFDTHLLLHCLPWQLVQLVHCRRYLTHVFILYTTSLENTIQHFTVVQLDFEVVNTQRGQAFNQNCQHLGIWHHWIIGTSNVKVALVEFSHSSLGHSRLVSSVNLGNVVSLYGADTVCRHKPCKWHSQVVSQRSQLTTLVLQVVDQLRILTVLTGQDLSELKNRCVECLTTVLLEHITESRENGFSQDHVLVSPIFGTFGRFQKKLLFLSLF